MKYMLDTNICIFVINKNSDVVLEKIRTNKFKNLSISTITLAELEYGVANSTLKEKNSIALHKFLSNIRILNFDDNAAIEYGKIRADLKRRGKPISMMDSLIAAHAIASDQILVTNNIREFERVNGLRIVDWTI